jgi:hypothetical protein
MREKLTIGHALINVARQVGARERDHIARNLLLHLDQLGKAAPEDLAVLTEYVRNEAWKSLYRHDRGMYLLLRAGAVKYKAQTHRLATVTSEGRVSKADGDADRSELEQRLHAHLDERCLVTRKGKKVFVDIVGDFSEAQLNLLAHGVQRVLEWEAA